MRLQKVECLVCGRPAAWWRSRDQSSYFPTCPRHECKTEQWPETLRNTLLHKMNNLRKSANDTTAMTHCWCKIQSSLKTKCTQITSETRHLASLQQYKSLKFQKSLSSDTNFLRVPKLSVNTRNQSSQNETNSKEKHKTGKKLWRACKHYQCESAELTQAFISFPTNPTSLELLLAPSYPTVVGDPNWGSFFQNSTHVVMNSEFRLC